MFMTIIPLMLLSWNNYHLVCIIISFPFERCNKSHQLIVFTCNYTLSYARYHSSISYAPSLKGFVIASYINGYIKYIFRYRFQFQLMFVPSYHDMKCLLTVIGLYVQIIRGFLSSVKTKTWQYWQKHKLLQLILNQYSQRITLNSGCHFKTVFIIATQMNAALDLKFVKWTKTCIAVEDVVSGGEERSMIQWQDSLCVHSTERFVKI